MRLRRAAAMINNMTIDNNSMIENPAWWGSSSEGEGVRGGRRPDGDGETSGEGGPPLGGGRQGRETQERCRASHGQKGADEAS